MRAPRCTVPAQSKPRLRRDDDAGSVAMLEVERLVEPVAAVLEQHVLARDAQRRRRRTARSVGTSVGRTMTNDTPGRLVARISLREVSGSSAGTMPAAREQRQRLVEDAALGQGDRQCGHGSDGGASRGPFYRSASALLPRRAHVGGAGTPRWCETG